MTTQEVTKNTPSEQTQQAQPGQADVLQALIARLQAARPGIILAPHQPAQNAQATQQAQAEDAAQAANRPRTGQ